jgi:hypothetical protein
VTRQLIEPLRAAASPSAWPRASSTSSEEPAGNDTRARLNHARQRARVVEHAEPNAGEPVGQLDVFAAESEDRVEQAVFQEQKPLAGSTCAGLLGAFKP